MVINKLEEDGETEHPEAGQEGVVDDVEDSDEEPGHGGPPHDGPGVAVIQEPGDSLPAMSLHWLDGGGSDGNTVSTHDERLLDTDQLLANTYLQHLEMFMKDEKKFKNGKSGKIHDKLQHHQLLAN